MRRLDNLIVILALIDETEKEKADVGRRVRYLSENFDVVILTHSASACRSLFPKARVIRLPLLNIHGGLMIFFISCWIVLSLMRTRLVYVAEMTNSPAVIFSLQKRVICYGNTHPLQHIALAGQGLPFVKRLFELFTRMLLLFGLRKCRRILAISPLLAQSYFEIGVDRSRVKILPVGVGSRFAQIHRTGAIDGTFIAVYPGTLSFERGLLIMIEAVNMLAPRRPDLRLRLVGATNSQKAMIEGLIAGTAAGAQIDVLPAIPNSQIPEILADCHCGISLLEPNPYFEASPPLKVLEFLAAGLPVIANDLPSHRLYLKNLFNAMIIDYDAESLATALETLMRDKALRLRLSLGARTRALELSDDVGLSELRETLMEETYS